MKAFSAYLKDLKAQGKISKVGSPTSMASSASS